MIILLDLIKLLVSNEATQMQFMLHQHPCVGLLRGPDCLAERSRERGRTLANGCDHTGGCWQRTHPPRHFSYPHTRSTTWIGRVPG